MRQKLTSFQKDVLSGLLVAGGELEGVVICGWFSSQNPLFGYTKKASVVYDALRSLELKKMVESRELTGFNSKKAYLITSVGRIANASTTDKIR